MSTRAPAALALLLVVAVLPCPAARAGDEPALAAASAAGETWEINGIRLERAQIDRLADDMAQRTVAAVAKKVEGIGLSDDQRARMHAIYRSVSLEVFADVVDVVERADLADASKDEEVRRLVIAGQQRSHSALQSVLDARQMDLYSRWEDQQVAAYRSRRWDRGRRRRR